MKKTYALTFALLVGGVSSICSAQSLPSLTSMAPSVQSLAPCPLGMTLTILPISMVPSCVGVPLQNIASQAAGSVAGSVAGAAGGAASQLTGAATGALSSAASGAAQQAIAPTASNQQTAIQQQSQNWGGNSNFGSVDGFGGITVRVISCDEYAAMNPSLVNPRNENLNYQQLSELGLAGQGEVQNGWWSQVLHYTTWPDGTDAAAEGGAVVQYASLNQSNGQNINQTAKIIAVGACDKHITPPDVCFNNYDAYGCRPEDKDD